MEIYRDYMTSATVTRHGAPEASNANLVFAYDVDGARVRKQTFYGNKLTKERTYVGAEEYGTVAIHTNILTHVDNRCLPLYKNQWSGHGAYAALT